jgi:hypothetical protein
VQYRRQHGREQHCASSWTTAFVFKVTAGWCRCNIRRDFSQNRDIVHENNGANISPTELVTWYLKLQDVGNGYSIKVTSEQVVTHITLSILHAKGLWWIQHLQLDREIQKTLTLHHAIAQSVWESQNAVSDRAMYGRAGDRISAAQQLSRHQNETP